MIDSDNFNAKKEQEATKKPAEKETRDSTPPNCGQVPVAMPQSTSAQHSDMSMAQIYALQISLWTLLILILIGMSVFRIRAERKRLAKKCPHCGMGLEHWADECGMCKKSIFVYPPAPESRSNR
jgi:hypothetical protein